MSEVPPYFTTTVWSKLSNGGLVTHSGARESRAARGSLVDTHSHTQLEMPHGHDVQEYLAYKKTHPPRALQ